MEGLTASELAMIKKLAGNDALARKQTTKKLKVWLKAICTKVPNTADCRALVENNFLRVWKALFYCMWMADKPLPQEQLAEQISDLVAIFSSKPVVFHLFVEWFFRTMAREWPYIDRLRLDKFQMLVRRFLRKTLKVIAGHEWKLEALDGFLRIISVYIFNRHPEVKSTRSKARDPAPELAPVGMQLHFVDIFLEELAKVGGDKLKSPKILKILSPFIQEMSMNDDDRILSDIEERIFRHLMRQSDVGIDYEEGVVYNPEENGGGESDDDDAGPDANGNSDLDDDEDMPLHDGPLDPRAGGVNVDLPQLMVDYNELSTKLTEAGGNKSVRMKNRKTMYSLARKFKALTSGEYPLAIEVDETSGPAIKKKDIDKAAKRLVALDEELSDGKTGKGRKPKKVRQKLGKLQQQMDLDSSTISDNNGSESDSNSFYLRDDELLDHVGDNYMSYLEELHQKEKANGNGNVDETDSDSKDNEEDETFNMTGTSQSENDILSTPIKSKKTKKEGVKSPKPALKTNSSPAISDASVKKKRRASAGLLSGSISESPDSTGNYDDFKSRINVTPKSGKKYKTVIEVEEDDSNEAAEQKETYLVLDAGNNKRKRKIANTGVLGSPLPQTPGTPASTKRKRVSFVLARNLQHEHSDYEQSINRSPAIPFDSGKQPGFGLLKSPVRPSPSTFLINGLQSTPRRKSVKF